MNSVSEKIDERILRLLGLEDVFDIDYDTYLTLLKEAIVIGAKKLPQEELAILANERKRIRGKKGRFKPKKDKITADKVATTKLLKGTKVSKKTLALSSAISKPDIQQQDLTGIGKPLESISKTLAALLKFSKKTSEEERRDKETQKRTKREEGLEGFKKGISAVSGAAKKMLAPFQSIIDRIWKFIFFTLLGRAFTQLMGWLGDPANKKKIEVLGRFLKDWWPALAFAAGLFLTPFGAFIRTTIGAVRAFIPQLIALTTNPAFLAITGATVGGIAGASLESNLRKVDETLLQRRIKESKDQGKPLSKQEIEKIKLEQLQKRVQDIQGTNLPGSALFASGGTVPRFSMGGSTHMGGINFGTGYDGIDGSTGQKVSGFEPDTQAIIAQPGEIVINKKTVDAVGAGHFLALNRQYGGPGANKPKMGRLYSTGGMVGNKNKIQNPKISAADFNSLLAISALEDTNPQGRADVAQSLYNRMFASQKYGINFNQTSSALKDIINAGGGRTTGGQYEPTFDNKSDWLNIKDKMSAAVAVMNSAKGKKYKWDIKEAMRQLDATESALKNPAFQAAAQKHVGGRTYFLGTSQQKNMKPGDVLRSPEQNFFSPWYTEGTPYDKARRNIAAPIPEMLLPPKSPQNKPQNQNIFQKVFSQIGSLIGPSPATAKPQKTPTKPQRWATDPRGWFGMQGGGQVKENTGMDIAGATADRQLIRAQPGEFMITKGAVTEYGIEFFNKINSVDYDSTAAKLGYRTKNIPKITPLNRGQSGMMTLPPITQSASGGGGGGSAAGSKVSSFSVVSQSGVGTRLANADLYGIGSLG